ncbi:MAG: hypothetical protein U9R54_01155 [Bacteroidota bacterium]|nr:hypothetical protein [Bacteroidota bacterium]
MTTCPKFQNCPIFKNNVLSSERTGETFKNLFCNAGPAKYKTCKRYIFAEKMNKPAPARILPSSALSISEIAEML